MISNFFMYWTGPTKNRYRTVWKTLRNWAQGRRCVSIGSIYSQLWTILFTSALILYVVDDWKHICIDAGASTISWTLCMATLSGKRWRMREQRHKICDHVEQHGLREFPFTHWICGDLKRNLDACAMCGWCSQLWRAPSWWMVDGGGIPRDIRVYVFDSEAQFDMSVFSWTWKFFRRSRVVKKQLYLLLIMIDWKFEWNKFIWSYIQNFRHGRQSEGKVL